MISNSKMKIFKEEDKAEDSDSQEDISESEFQEAKAADSDSEGDISEIEFKDARAADSDLVADILENADEVKAKDPDSQGDISESKDNEAKGKDSDSKNILDLSKKIEYSESLFEIFKNGKKLYVDVRNLDGDEKSMHEEYEESARILSALMSNYPKCEVFIPYQGRYGIDEINLNSLRATSMEYHLLKVKMAAPMIPGPVQNIICSYMWDYLHSIIGMFVERVAEFEVSDSDFYKEDMDFLQTSTRNFLAPIFGILKKICEMVTEITLSPPSKEHKHTSAITVILSPDAKKKIFSSI